MKKRQVELQHGFLPLTDPLKRLPLDFAPWEELAIQLPKRLVGNSFRKQVEKLPDFPIQKIKTPAEEERAMLILSFLGHAYLWGCLPKLAKIPAELAKPWCALAQRLDRPPVLSYASYALHNWYRLDPEGPIELGNIALLQNFLGGIDEEWFVLVHVDIEEKAALALQMLIPAQEAAQRKQPDVLVACLKKIETSLENMCATLDRMPEHCDPYIYYNRVRPYIHGWKNNPALPHGLIYESCFDNQPQYFRGETGAQSSIIPALDLLFGIMHEEDELSVYLKEMRLYMPRDHRDFLNFLAQQGAIRHYVSETAPRLPELRERYNQCIALIVRFRFTHLKYAALYIQKQSQQTSNNPNAVGTGGTPFMNYLSKHELETEKYKL